MSMIVVGCFHKPTLDNTGTNPQSTGEVATWASATGSAFDPQNFEDPEVEEVFDLLEELVQEDEQSDQQVEKVMEWENATWTVQENVQ